MAKMITNISDSTIIFWETVLDTPEEERKYLFEGDSAKALCKEIEETIDSITSINSGKHYEKKSEEYNEFKKYLIDTLTFVENVEALYVSGEVLKSEAAVVGIDIENIIMTRYAEDLYYNSLLKYKYAE